MPTNGFYRMHIFAAATALSLFVLFSLAIVEAEKLDVSYAESFAPPFSTSYEFRSLRNKRQSSNPTEPVKVVADDDSDEDDPDSDNNNNTTSDAIRLPNETNWWTNASHISVSHTYYQLILHNREQRRIDDYWQDIPALLTKPGVTGEKYHKQLANSYRRAVSQKLSFKFPFYGHDTEQITIATGGFAYVGEHVHTWLAATQYIAPLMANFDTTTSTESNIMFADTGDMFVVEWNEVVLKHQNQAGNFTFQVVLLKNGDIWFVYKTVPIEVKDVDDIHHPRKVGLSDAYLITQSVYNAISRRVIYEYHRVEVQLDWIKSGVVIEIKALPVCIALKSCRDCMNATLQQFNCSWCPIPSETGTSFCSDEEGLHRRRQDWISSHCNRQTDQIYCSDSGQTTTDSTDAKSESSNPKDAVVTESPMTDLTKAAINADSADKPESADVPKRTDASEITSQKIAGSGGMSPGSVVALLFVIVCVIGLAGWIIYAYYNPHTPSGQFLIRYRPTRWRWPGSHGDVRYTASVHM